jgi:GNAT superfamily N-acetyltransferase
VTPAATPSIRVATPDDAEILHRLICALAEYEREPDAVEVTPEILREQLAAERPPFECVLAVRDGEALGFALFFESYSTWTGRPGIYLEDLYVVESERGNGTGRALLRRLAEIAVERGCGRLELAALDWNEPAIGFYRRHGAEPMDEWTVYRFAGEALRRLRGV